MGRLIAVSGLDGAGKTTLAHALMGRLTVLGLRAEEIEMGPSRAWRWTEALGGWDPSLRPFFTSDRLSLALNFERFAFAADHLRPALDVNDYVIVQRFTLDWAATGRSFGATEAESRLIQAFHAFLAVPALTVHLEVSPELAAERIAARGRSSDARESESALRRTARAYRELIPNFSDVVCVDGTLPTAEQVDLAVCAVNRWSADGRPGVRRQERERNGR